MEENKELEVVEEMKELITGVQQEELFQKLSEETQKELSNGKGDEENE